MFNRFFNIFIALLLCCYALTLHAIVVSSLYSAKIPVASHSSQERSKTISAALQQTLIKVNGHTNIVAIPKIKDALNNAARYVSEFSYTSTPNPDKPWLLNIRFSQTLINQLLSKSGLSVWTKNRHLILTWVVIKNDKSLTLITNDSTHAVTASLSQNASNRGLPLIFPMLDLTDLQKINPTNVWMTFIPTIQQASSRYNPDAILIVRIDTSNKANMIGHWLLLSNHEKMRWEIDGSNLNEIIRAGIGNIANTLASQYAISKNNTAHNTVSLTVENLQGIADYAKVIRYLRGLPNVITTEALNISSAQASFNLTLSSSVERLMRNIRLGNLLQPISDDNPNSQQPQTLYYRLEGI